jgi:hypothetical protein
MVQSVCPSYMMPNSQQIEWEHINYIHLVQDKDVLWDFCEHCVEPSGSIKGGEFLN